MMETPRAELEMVDICFGFGTPMLSHYSPSAQRNVQLRTIRNLQSEIRN
jgi:hypothetical protein